MTATTFADIRRNRLCQKVTKKGNILEASEMVHGDTCCVAGGDANVIQRHGIEY